jgi:hypothetical protein
VVVAAVTLVMAAAVSIADAPTRVAGGFCLCNCLQWLLWVLAFGYEGFCLGCLCSSRCIGTLLGDFALAVYVAPDV